MGQTKLDKMREHVAMLEYTYLDADSVASVERQYADAAYETWQAALAELKELEER